VFVQSGTTWVEQARLLPSNGQHYSLFGNSVALVDGQAIIGAPGQDWLVPPSIYGGGGAAYVFTESHGTWKQRQELHVSDPAPYDAFGYAAVATEDTVLLSAPGKGHVYVFERRRGDRTSDLWQERERIAPSGNGWYGTFGYSMDVCGRTLFVGNPYVGVGDIAEAGSVFVFTEEERQGRAGLVNRTAASNPASYVASAPVLGDRWRATVDLSSSGHSVAAIQGRLRPAQLRTASGATLLVDLTSPAVFHLPPRPAPGGVASWDLVLPTTPSLAGLTIYTQAILLSPFLPYALSNAQDLSLGF
jgi:hypothetical protein